MRFSLRTLALATPVLLGVFLGLDAKPARAQYIGSPYGTYNYAPSGSFIYSGGVPGYNAYNPGYYSGGVNSWAPGAYGGWRYGGARRTWAPPRMTRRQRYMLVPPSI
jgi:hypothetical protein